MTASAAALVSFEESSGLIALPTDDARTASRKLVSGDWRFFSSPALPIYGTSRKVRAHFSGEWCLLSKALGTAFGRFVPRSQGQTMPVGGDGIGYNSVASIAKGELRWARNTTFPYPTIYLCPSMTGLRIT
jgi:hypothetical protein